MKKVAVLDPSILSYNLGNQIIAESIFSLFDSILLNSFIVKLQYAERLGNISKKHISSADLTILAGTNSLSSNILGLEQFPLSLKDLLTLKNILLCGVGWYQYENIPNFFNQKLLKHFLNDEFNHSVRDSYTKNMLKKIGITNVINTSCPSLWNITKVHLLNIPTQKAENVVITLTDYNKSFKNDMCFIEKVAKEYKKIYFWPQGAGDKRYLESILKKSNANIEFIAPNLSSYDKFLIETNTDYIGNRLHAGIRAIQFGKRTHIIEIDNRASEISKDINLWSSKRGNLESLSEFIESREEMELSIPYDDINFWKSQFSEL